MCRKHQIIAVALVAFGAGMLFGGWIEWHFIRILAALGLMGLGFFQCGGNRRHK